MGEGRQRRNAAKNAVMKSQRSCERKQWSPIIRLSPSRLSVYIALEIRSARIDVLAALLYMYIALESARLYSKRPRIYSDRRCLSLMKYTRAIIMHVLLVSLLKYFPANFTFRPQRLRFFPCFFELSTLWASTIYIQRAQCAHESYIYGERVVLRCEAFVKFLT